MNAPSCVPVIFGPHVTPHCPAPSWWTSWHVSLVAVAAGLAVLMFLDRRRLYEIAWAVRHRREPSSVFCPPVRWDGERWVPAGRQVTVREWLRLSRQERKDRRAAFRAADDALKLNYAIEEDAGITEEAEAHHALNGRVCDLWGTVPWWCRQ